jgi:glycosyltransferase involved in cell wall biosynthesis
VILSLKKILIIDQKKRPPYSSEMLQEHPLNGTVGSVLRLAEKLGEICEVYVLQQDRKTITRGNNRVTYGPLEMCERISDPHAVISLSLNSRIGKILKRYPQAIHIAWCHDIPYFTMTYSFRELEGAGVTVVGVSNFHKKALKALFVQHNLPLNKMVFDYIYNPIDDYLLPDETPFDPNKLLFCSNPMKGIENVIKCFNTLLQVNSHFQLYLANPSRHFNLSEFLDKENIHFLGELTHQETIRHLRESLCLFYPNFYYPETFGLVFAESEAVGTPVITHNLGAASEVLSNPEQIVDATNYSEVVSRLMKWRNGERAKVAVNEEFRLSNVFMRWCELLNLY